MNVKFLRKFASEAEIAQLKDWILLLRKYGVLQANPAGPGRFYVALGAVADRPPAINRINRDLMNAFSLVGKCIELTDLAQVERTQSTPSFVGMQTEGGYVHPHLDVNVGEERQFRCTLLVSKPEIGGKLVLADQEYEMEEGDMYCFVSNNTIHGTTAMGGNKPRMACSLGFIVDKDFRLERFGEVGLRGGEWRGCAETVIA